MANVFGIGLIILGFLIIAIPAMFFGSATYEAKVIDKNDRGICTITYSNDDGPQTIVKECTRNEGDTFPVFVDKTSKDDWMTVFAPVGVMIMVIGGIIIFAL
jgi:hypothetical protein